MYLNRSNLVNKYFIINCKYILLFYIKYVKLRCLEKKKSEIFTHTLLELSIILVTKSIQFCNVACKIRIEKFNCQLKLIEKL